MKDGDNLPGGPGSWAPGGPGILETTPGPWGWGMSTSGFFCYRLERYWVTIPCIETLVNVSHRVVLTTAPPSQN